MPVSKDTSTESLNLLDEPPQWQETGLIPALPPRSVTVSPSKPPLSAKDDLAVHKGQPVTNKGHQREDSRQAETRRLALLKQKLAHHPDDKVKLEIVQLKLQQITTEQPGTVSLTWNESQLKLVVLESLLFWFKSVSIHNHSTATDVGALALQDSTIFFG